MICLSEKFSNDPMLDMFIFETVQLIEQLEQLIIGSERSSVYTQDSINEIFRIMHTIKGSSAMMLYENISTLAHTIEDLFYFLREKKPMDIDYLMLTDLVLNGTDFIKNELSKIIRKKKVDGDTSELIKSIKNYLSDLKSKNSAKNSNKQKELQCVEKIGDSNKMALDTSKNSYKVIIHYEEGCEMENIRAFETVNNLKEITEQIHFIPEDIIDNENCKEIIRNNGFMIFFSTDRSYDEMYKYFVNNVVFLKDLQLFELKSNEYQQSMTEKKVPLMEGKHEEAQYVTAHQSIISVNIDKLDKLMDLVGELVISEAMVLQNPDLKGLSLDNFKKAARQLQKITGELQDTVMSTRMVSLSTTFQKMNRIVRDMSKKLKKEVRLEIIGEETEVDKNIIDNISDPLMHIIRNSIDHGIETSEERILKGKPEYGTITLEAKSAGGDVSIIVRDDGRGLNKEKILEKARDNGLIKRPERELTDKEIYSYILNAGFSTKDNVTEFSGRGVGMDVVTKNIDAIGGIVSVNSIEKEGTTITLKMPLTLAIVNSMIIRTGRSIYSLPIISIRESFKAKDEDIIIDPDGNEMIMIRGQCYPILRLHELYKIKTEIAKISDGIIIMVENDEDTICIFADQLIGEQEVVVKALPNYIRNLKKVRGISGCTLLGDGSISLILDIADLIECLKGKELKK